MGIRVFTAFSGYDSQCMALERAGIQYDLVGWSEIDKWAIMAHNAVFPQFKDRNYGDITKIDWNDVPDFDLFTYSSPCQDFSKAGQLRGGERGSGTRSSLLWSCEEAIRRKKPKYAIMENVENLVSERFIHLFREWEQLMAAMGYNNFWKVIPATDCGVPQNRKRVFLVSILDHERFFDFPSPKNINDLDSYLLPNEIVDERYCVKREKLSLVDDSNSKELRIRQATKECSIPIFPGGVFDNNRPRSRTKRGRVQGGGRICPTLTANASQEIIRYFKNKRGENCFRRLTPLECFRLQGVSDEDFGMIQRAGICKTQLYHLAGNSICVDVLTGIFSNLLNGCEKPEDYLF